MRVRPERTWIIGRNFAYARRVQKNLLRTALLLPVPEAEPVVDTWRARFDPSAANGVPAHITLIFPYLPSDRCTATIRDKLREIFARSVPIDLELAAPGMFPGVLYLTPEPAGPITRLIERLVCHFPEAPPYGGAFTTIIPHLTIAHSCDAALRDRIISEISPALPVRCIAREVMLMREEVDGHWRVQERFPLGTQET